MSGNVGRVLFYYPYAFIVRLLPLSTVYAIIDIQAKVWNAFINKKKKKHILKKFKSAFEKRVSSYSFEEMFLQFLRTQIIIKTSVLLYAKLAKENPKKTFSVTNPHYIDEALSAGSGAILTTAHFGPSMLMTFWAGRHYNTGLLRLLHNKKTNHYGQQLAQRTTRKLSRYIPVTYIDVQGDLSLRDALLKDNGILVQTGDGASVLTGIGKLLPVKFFSKKVLFAKGPFSLAHRTKAPIVPYFLKHGKYRFEIEICPPLVIDTSKPRESSINDAMQEFAACFEKHFIENPGSWQLWELFEKGKLIV
jgi:lauroyl/myristoyl acyltransferase